MQRGVVGLYFDEGGKHVVLLHKRRPTWQLGHLNGPGGRIEVGESPVGAMTREFLEETGVLVSQWRLVCVLRGQESKLFFFAAHGDVLACSTMTDEIVEVVEVDQLARREVVYNLRWIVPLALDPQIGDLTGTVK